MEPPQEALFGYITSHYDSLHSGQGMARHVYTNASEKYSQNVDLKLRSNPMLFEDWKICINQSACLAVL